MQKISVSLLETGMITSRNVFGADGQLLLGDGVKLTNNYIKRLKEMGIPAVYIQNEYLKDVEVPLVLAEETRVKAIFTVQAAFGEFQKYKRISLNKLNSVAKLLIDEIILNSKSMVHLTDIRTYDDYTFGHSVNVCVLSVLTGITLGYNELKLKELALGALLHDVGKIAVPVEILNKPGKLNDEEMAVMQKHSEQGFEILRKNPEISLLVSHVAFQHHERYNGSGYPRGLCGQDIHEYARIVALADMYDAMTADRSYRKAMPPHAAYEILLASSQYHFDIDILRVFISNIAIYPVGSVVELNNGSFGIVVKVQAELQTRPTVQLIDIQSGRKGKLLDLTNNLTIFVSKVLNESETIAFWHSLSSKDS
jgi:HD-GYP domain-containing protein (c-di-GMP phosphodiesterase class II)